MRDLGNVVVTDAIVHILEPKAGYRLLSERSIPLKNNPNLSQYFADYIQLSIRDQAARSARFTTHDDGKSLACICHKMFESGAGFVEGSREFAQRLYAVMEGDARVVDGDMVVCSYKAEGKSNNIYLAVIKLDPVGAFRNIEITDKKTGKKYVDLQIDPNIFPRDTEALQKGAYFGRSNNKKDINILLVDKQTKRGEIARFFYEDFLDASFVWDSSELTMRLYKCLIETLNEQRSTLTPAQDKYLGSEIYAVFNTEGEFDISAWLNSLNTTTQLKDELTKKLNEWLPKTKKIKRDLWLSKELTKRRTFSGDGRSWYSIPSGDYDTMVKSVTRKQRPGRQPFYEIIIETSNWWEEW